MVGAWGGRAEFATSNALGHSDGGQSNPAKPQRAGHRIPRVFCPCPRHPSCYL